MAPSPAAIAAKFNAVFWGNQTRGTRQSHWQSVAHDGSWSARGGVYGTDYPFDRSRHSSGSGGVNPCCRFAAGWFLRYLYSQKPVLFYECQVTIRDGAQADLTQLHDGLGLGDKRISVVREDAAASRGAGGLPGQEERADAAACALPQRAPPGGQKGALVGGGEEEEEGDAGGMEGKEGGDGKDKEGGDSERD